MVTPKGIDFKEKPTQQCVGFHFPYMSVGLLRRIAALLGWVKLITNDAYNGARAHVQTHSMITGFSDAAFPDLSEDEGKSKSNLESQYAFAVAGK